MADLDSDSKSTPLIKYRQQQENQLAQGPSKTNLGGGDEVPTRLTSEGVRRSYDDQCETTLTGASTLY
jgi:hypothetical protein